MEISGPNSGALMEVPSYGSLLQGIAFCKQ
jgi:hypothetical protein